MGLHGIAIKWLWVYTNLILICRWFLFFANGARMLVSLLGVIVIYTGIREKPCGCSSMLFCHCCLFFLLSFRKQINISEIKNELRQLDTFQKKGGVLCSKESFVLNKKHFIAESGLFEPFTMQLLKPVMGAG